MSKGFIVIREVGYAFLRTTRGAAEKTNEAIAAVRNGTAELIDRAPHLPRGHRNVKFRIIEKE